MSRRSTIFYLETPQLWEQDTDWRGFEWISHEDNRNNIIAFRRIAKDGSDIVIVVNFSPEIQENYRIGVPISGTYEEVFSSDKTEFGGSGIANGKVKTDSKKPMHGQEQSISIHIPRFGVLFFKGKPRAKRRTKAEIEAAKKAAAAKAAKGTRASTKAVSKTGTRAVTKTGSKAVAKTGEKAVAKTSTKAVTKTGGKGGGQGKRCRQTGFVKGDAPKPRKIIRKPQKGEFINVSEKRMRSHAARRAVRAAASMY